MKKIISYVLISISLLFILTRCSKMNDKLDVYMASGERTYIGKIDSLKTFAGDKRVKLRFWASDPRIKKVAFYWYPNNDSILVEINHTSAVDSFDVYVGGSSSTKTIEEGNYTLKVISRDLSSHISIPFEKIVNIYGDHFRASLTNRVLKTVAYQATNATLSLTFSGPTNDKEIGIGIQYSDKQGVAKTLILANKAITSPVNLLNVDKTKSVIYKTMFLPEPFAIDTFYTSNKNIVIP